jgi:hypothetical protein
MLLNWIISCFYFIIFFFIVILIVIYSLAVVLSNSIIIYALEKVEPVCTLDIYFSFVFLLFCYYNNNLSIIFICSQSYNTFSHIIFIFFSQPGFSSYILCPEGLSWFIIIFLIFFVFHFDCFYLFLFVIAYACDYQRGNVCVVKFNDIPDGSCFIYWLIILFIYLIISS